MDPLYSASLLVSLASAAGAVVCAVAATIVLRSKGASGLSYATRLVRISSLLIVLGIVAGAVSVVVHSYWGHGPSSPEPLSAGAFIRAHPSYVIDVVLLCVAFALALRARRKIAALEPRGDAV